MSLSLTSASSPSSSYALAAKSLPLSVMLRECSGYATLMHGRDPAIHDGGPGPAIPASLWRWLISRARSKLEDLALIALHQPADYLSNLAPGKPYSFSTPSTSDHFRWSYAQLMAAANRLAAHLDSRGVSKGDVVVTFVENSVEWIVLLWACVRAGAVLSSHDPAVLNRRDELQSIIEATQPRAVLVKDTLEAAKFKSQSKSWRCAMQLVCRGKREQLLDNWQLFSDLGIPDHHVPSIPDTHPDDVALIQYSSGSTNQPKGCPHSFRTIFSAVSNYRAFNGSDWTAEKTTFVLTAQNHVASCYLGCLNTFSAGGCIVIPEPSFYPETALQAIHQTQATHLMLVPSQLRALMSSPDIDAYRPSSLKLIVVSGDTVSQDLIEKAEVELRAKNVVLSWSMSEGGPAFGWHSGERVRSYNNVPMVGRPLSGSLVKICVSGSDVPARYGDIGDLHVSSSCFINEYVGGGYRDSFYNEGLNRWFVTGDMAVMDEDGAVSIVGRAKDVINCSGWPLLPSIIEDYIKECFGIESQAIGVPNPSTGEKPVAVIKVRKASIDLKQEMKQGLPRHSGSEYTLGAVYLLSELGLKDWPLGQTQKVSKADLKTAVLQSFPSKPVGGLSFPMYDFSCIDERDFGF